MQEGRGSARTAACPYGAVKCPHTDTCAYALADCAALPTNDCPAATPLLCYDGATCAADFADCPTQVECGTGLTRCFGSNACVADHKDCPELTACPAPLTARCPDGECAPSLATAGGLCGRPTMGLFILAVAEGAVFGQQCAMSTCSDGTLHWLLLRRSNGVQRVASESGRVGESALERGTAHRDNSAPMRDGERQRVLRQSCEFGVRERVA